MTHLREFGPHFEHYLTDYQFAQAFASTLTETVKQQLASIHGYAELILLRSLGLPDLEDDSLPRFSDTIFRSEQLHFSLSGFNESVELLSMYPNVMRYLEQMQAHKLAVPLIGHPQGTTLDLVRASKQSAFKQLFPR